MSANRVHSTAFVGANVTLGSGNVVGPFAVITGHTRLGDDNWVGPNAAIGTPGQSRGHEHEVDWWQDGRTKGDDLLVLGDRNIIREFATVHAGTVRATLVGNDCYLMTQSHVPHDAILEDGVTLANAVQVGGHSYLGRAATLGLGAVVHQRSVIGAGSMIGMSAVVVRPVPPFTTAVGSPARARGTNLVGLQRAGLDEDQVAAVEDYQREPSTDTFGRLPPLIQADFTRYESALAATSPNDAP